MNGLYQTICRIGIFMICAQAVVHFRPQDSYEKYLKLLVSAMVLIQLFLPVSRLLFHGDGGELAAKSQAFLEGLETELSDAERKAYETDALLEQMTLEEIRRRVEETRITQSPEPQNTSDTIDGGSGHTSDHTADDTEKDTVHVEKIQVEEIRVRLPSETPEPAGTEQD